MLRSQVQRQVYGDEASHTHTDKLHTRSDAGLLPDPETGILTIPSGPELQATTGLDSLPFVFEDFQLDGPWNWMHLDDNNTPAQEEDVLWSRTEG